VAEPLAGESGVTAVEYGLLAALIGVVFVAAGPRLWQGVLGVLDAVLGRMLS
jgi:Flp pilus assembly pilin Flp